VRNPLSLTNARIKLVNTGSPSLNWIYGFSGQTSRIAERVSIICQVSCARLKDCASTVFNEQSHDFMAKDNPDILHRNRPYRSFSPRTTINFCIALSRQLWKDFRIFERDHYFVHIHVCTHICTDYTKCFPCRASHCLFNQIWLLDHYSLTISEPSTLSVRHAPLSLFEILDKRDILSSRESTACFPLANARTSEITLQHGMLGTVTFRYGDPECSYAKINRNLTFAREKREIRGTFLPICIRRLRDFQ